MIYPLHNLGMNVIDWKLSCASNLNPRKRIGALHLGAMARTSNKQLGGCYNFLLARPVGLTKIWAFETLSPQAEATATTDQPVDLAIAMTRFPCCNTQNNGHDRK